MRSFAVILAWRPLQSFLELFRLSQNNFWQTPEKQTFDVQAKDFFTTMSSKFSLQAPYVVASLPRPIDFSSGRYVVGEVFVGAQGSKKRKRSELVVGVDGEGVNLYDVGIGMKLSASMI